MLERDGMWEFTRPVFGIFVRVCNSRSSYGSCTAGNDDASCRDQGSASTAPFFAAAVSCDTSTHPTLQTNAGLSPPVGPSSKGAEVICLSVEVESGLIAGDGSAAG